MEETAAEAPPSPPSPPPLFFSLCRAAFLPLHARRLAHALLARLSKAEYDDMMEVVDGCLAIDAACLAAPEFVTLRKVCDRLVFWFGGAAHKPQHGAGGKNAI